MTSASIGVKLLSVALNALSGLAISLLIKGITWAIDELIVTTEEAKETLNESVSEFESLTDEVKSLETELKTCTERLADLQKLANNGTISIADEEQLRLLKEENEELERKLALKQAEQIDSQKEVLKNAKQLSDKEVKSKYILQDIDGGIYYEKVNPAEELIAAIDKYNEFKENPNGYGFIDEQYVESASKRVQEMYDIISPTIDAYNKLIDAGYILTGEDKKRYEQLKQVQDEYLLYNYSLNGTKEAFQGLNVAQQKNIVLNRLLNQGLSDIQANSVLSNINEDDLDDLWGSDFSFTPPDMKDTSTAEEYGKAYAEAWLASIGETIQDEDNKIDDSRTKMISSINDMSEGFEELDKIYSSIKDDNPFDFKLLDNKAFKETFSTLDGYADFIEQITSNSDDIDACQSAFNNLVSEWITSTNVLDNVTKENEKLTAAMLKQMGVTNADEIAHYALEKAKAKEYVQSKDNINVTEDNINSLINEANTAGITTNAYLELVAKEILFNDNDINTASKCEQILAIAKTAGIASASLSALNSEIANVAGKKIGSGARTEYAQSKGVEVISEKNRKDGKKNGNLYVVGGKEFDDFTEAMQYAEAYNTMQNISSAFSQYTVPTYTGGSKSNSSSSSKDTKETFDWIETKISRLQRTITNFGKTVSATWKSWTDRNSALKSQISAVTSEINLQANAANKYLSLANSVGLGEGYKSLVRNGALDISTVRDENTIDAIKKYQEYYENYLSALDAKQDAEDELRNLKQTSADNISTEYDDLVSFIEHEKSMLDSTANILENKGYMASASIYDKLIQYEYDTISTLEEKYKKLNENLNNSGIQQGTEQWNDMKLEILEVEEAILESKNALVEYNNTLRDLEWEVFDKLQEKISGITEEADFLIKLMSDEKMFDEGKITEHGQATLGLYALNYKTYLAQAEEYGQKLEEIRGELENDPYNQTLLEQEKKWTEALRDSILASEDALQSIVDLKQEGFDSLLESLDDAIAKYKDLIHEQKNAYDYQKQIDNLTGDVTKYQKIMKSLEGMGDTEEGKKLIQEYSVKLRDSEEALAEAENEKYLADLDKLLQNLSDDATEFVSQKMDNVDALIEEVIAQTETNTGSILETLKTETSNVGTSITQEMEKVWGTNGTFTTSLDSVVDMFEKYFDNLQKEADEKAKQTIASTPSGGSSSGSTTPTTSTHAPSTGSSGSSSSSGWGSWFVSKTYAKQNLNPETSIVDRLKSKNINADFSYRSQYYRAMGGSGIYTGSASQNRWMLAQMKSHGFAQGGTIGNLIKATGEDGFVLARKGEGILTPENMKMLENVMVTMNPIVDSLAKLPSLPDVQSRYGGNTSVGDVSVTFDLPNVKNYSEFMTQMQNDPKFEGMILHMTFGKNSMDKYKYKWN